MNEKRLVQWLVIALCAIYFAPNAARAGRQYSPEAKRFMQRDPILHVDGLHAYVPYKNSPVQRIDPSGEDSVVAPTMHPIAEVTFTVVEEVIGVGLGLGIEFIASLPIGTLYGPAYSHCLAHCLMAKSPYISEPQSRAIGEETERRQKKACDLLRCLVPSNCSGVCKSANQQSDYYDNQLGRSVAASGSNCGSGCKAAMGGKSNHPEGPGTNRPYGPQGCPPGPSGNPDAPMPPNWGP